MKLIADSGSTKTDWCLTNGSGGKYLRLRTQGINPFHQDKRQIAAILTGELLPQLGGEQPSEVYFYGSGCRPELQPGVCRLLREALPKAVVVEAQGDLLGAARAVCGRREGLVIILGTGANSGLYDGHTIVSNTPPLGYILGDEGSGAVIGKQFLNALYRGLLPAALADELEADMGVTLPGAIDRVYRQPMANRFLASLSPFIHAHLDVPEVSQLVTDSFRLFFRRNLVQYDRYDLPVGAVGSIASHYRQQLVHAAAAEGFTIGTILPSPIEGLITYHH